MTRVRQFKPRVGSPNGAIIFREQFSHPPQESAMALVQSAAKRARAMHDWSELSSWPEVEGVHSCRLPTAGVGSPSGAHTMHLDDASQVASFSVITLRNDTRSPVKFDLR